MDRGFVCRLLCGSTLSQFTLQAHGNLISVEEMIEPATCSHERFRSHGPWLRATISHARIYALTHARGHAARANKV